MKVALVATLIFGISAGTAAAASWISLGKAPMKTGAIAGDGEGNVTMIGTNGDLLSGWDLDVTTRPRKGAWTPLSTLTENPSYSFANPFVRVNSGGEAVATWGEGFILPTPHAAVRDSAGNWSAPGPVTPDTTSMTDADITEDGTAIVAWATATEVKARMRPRGGNWGEVTIISTPGHAAGGSPDVAVNSKGEIAVAWIEADEPGGSKMVARLRKFRPGTGWSAPEDASTADEGIFTVAVDIDEEGRAVVAWTKFQSGYEVWANTRSANGTWGTPIKAGDGTDQRVSINNTGRAAIVWVNPAGSQVRIQVRSKPAAGSWTQPKDLAQANTAEDAYVLTMLLGETSDGSTVATWIFSSTSATAFQASRLGESGNWIGLGEFVFSQGPTVVGTPSQDPQGNVLLAWDSYPDTSAVVLDAAAPELRNLVFPTRVTAGKPATFSVEPHDIWSDVTTRWIFPEGDLVEANKASHTFSNTGKAMVRLIVSDSVGNSTTLSRQVEVTGGAASKCQAMRKSARKLRAKVARTKARIKRLNRQIRRANSPARKRALAKARKRARKALKKQKRALRKSTRGIRVNCR